MRVTCISWRNSSKCVCVCLCEKCLFPLVVQQVLKLCPFCLSFCPFQVYVNRRTSSGEVMQQIPTETKWLLWHKRPSALQCARRSSLFWFQSFKRVICWCTAQKSQHFSVRVHRDGFRELGNCSKTKHVFRGICVFRQASIILFVLISLLWSHCCNLPTMGRYPPPRLWLYRTCTAIKYIVDVIRGCPSLPVCGAVS